MRRLIPFIILLCVTYGNAQEKPKPAPKRTVAISMRDGLRFDPPRFTANPGERLVITLENADSTHQTHNFIVTQPGQRDKVVQEAMALAEKGFEKSFAPDGDDVVVHSTLVEAEKKTTVEFTVPEKPGIYPYVCTFPGHGMVMYGAMYVATDMPPIDQDTNLPPVAKEAAQTGGGKRPFIQRMFVPDAGPAAIAIALPNDQNVVWDAGQCRLRYAWEGGFIDARPYWGGNGSQLAQVPSKPWWSAPRDAFPFRIRKADAQPPKVKFLGYSLEKGFPVFSYTLDGISVTEKIESVPGGIAVRYRFANCPQPIFFFNSGDGVKWTSSAGEAGEKGVLFTAGQSAEFTLTVVNTQKN